MYRIKDLAKLGFTLQDYGLGDDVNDFIYENDKFRIIVNYFNEVYLQQINPDSDYIQIKCQDMSDLRNLLNFIQDK